MENIKLSKVIKVSIYLSKLLVLGVVFLMPMLLTLGVRYIPLGFQPSFSGSEKVFKDSVITQSFITGGDNLVAIGISVRNLNLQTKGDLVVDIKEGGEVIRSSKVSGYSIKDGDIVRFTFNPIPGSLSRNYEIRVSAPGVSINEAFEVYTTREKTDRISDMYVNGNKIDKSLAFISYDKSKSVGRLMLEIYKDWSSKFFKDTFFTFFYGTISLTLVLFLFIKKPIR